MKKNDAKVMLGLLEELAGYFSSQTCNDIELPNTPENKRLVKAVMKQLVATGDYEEGDPTDYKAKKFIISQCSILRYVTSLFMEEHKLKDKDIPKGQIYWG